MQSRKRERERERREGIEMNVWIRPAEGVRGKQIYCVCRIEVTPG